MSQFVFPVSEEIECMVGWDVQMQTFFGQVYKVDENGDRLDAEEGGTLLWVGSKNCEIRTVDELARQLISRAIIPNDIRKKLYEIEID